ncbi:MAG: endonuclease IV, partial [Clostridia bacterium]|nr:endonuclease IV [Clostridia bacterium]
KERMYLLRDEIYKHNLQHLTFCPEVMGKINQIGDLIEVLQFCTIDPCFIPTIDFGHLNARTHGMLKTEKDFEEVIERTIETIGFEKASRLHVHFSKIEYSKGGEVKHLTFEDQEYGPKFENFVPVLAKYKLSPVVICESDGTQAEDALYMKQLYQNYIGENK